MTFSVGLLVMMNGAASAPPAQEPPEREDAPPGASTAIRNAVPPPPFQAAPGEIGSATGRSELSAPEQPLRVGPLAGAVFGFQPDTAAILLEARSFVSRHLALGLGLLVPFDDTEETIADPDRGDGTLATARLSSYPTRLWLGLGVHNPEHFLHVGPEVLALFESARCEDLYGATRRRRVVPGVGLRGTAGWTVGPRLMVTVEGALDYVAASLGSRFTYTRVGPEPSAASIVDVLRPEPLAGFIGLGTGVVF